ncbi:hypothetical protein [Microbacterium testaceum]|uniref:hypothetical protein n=1 Tax=Microbacterium testaceum TaxID=2033 RepID=UPI002AC67480|nr:hypothetical protein [Microbacterium testaceum]MDZ5146377.1 hypothetical protein [Microbacterium testaceum]
MSASKKESYSWPWVLGTLITGLALIGLAHLGDLVWSWPEITTGSIANVGAAFLIAFLLFIVERRFTRTITRSVEATAGATASVAAREAVKEQTEVLSRRITSLEEEFAERRAATEQRQNARVDAVATDLSAETTWQALDEMIQVGAIRNGVVVSASSAAPYPLIEFEIRTQMAHPYPGSPWESDREVIRRLMISAVVEPEPNSIGIPYFDWEWSETESFADAMAQIDAKMRRAERLREAKLLDPAFAAAEFSRALTLVKNDQQTPVGDEQLHGVLQELHSDNWAITTEGIQHLIRGLFVTWADLNLKTGHAARQSPAPQPPSGISAEDWSFLYGRLQHYAPQGGQRLF